MTNLEQFLDKNKEVKIMEPASGSFSCQDLECEEIVFEGFIDRNANKIVWICSKDHKSSVTI
jgi:hypothetical protein